MNYSSSHSAKFVSLIIGNKNSQSISSVLRETSYSGPVGCRSSHLYLICVSADYAYLQSSSEEPRPISLLLMPCDPFCRSRSEILPKANISLSPPFVSFFPGVFQSSPFIPSLRCGWNLTDCGRLENVHFVHLHTEHVFGKPPLLMHDGNLSSLMYTILGSTAGE